jgi:hypothetical protein
MNRNSKKVWPALAISLVLATSFVNAADNADMNRSKPNMDMQKKQQGSMGMITPPVNPCVQGCDFSFGVEALYMRATEDSTSVGFGIPASTEYPQTIPSVNQQYDWSWGARVDAGYAMDHDGWDLQAQWTWFHSSHTHDRHAAVGGFGFPVAPVNPLTAPYISLQSTDLNSHRRLLINMGDLDLGREFFISKWLVLRPHCGARGVWIERRLTVDAINITATPTGLASNTSHITTHSKGSYNAGGLYIGLDSQWGFGDGWSLFGMIDQSLVYGRNNLNIYEVDYTTNGAKYTRANSPSKWNTVRGITDLAIGLRWDYMFGNDSYRFRLQAAWEEHLFSNLDVNTFGSSGDLALTGASFKASFDF